MTDKPDFADSLQAQMIADYVSDGMTLVDACRNVGVGYSTIFRKIDESERFAKMMNAAREAGYDIIANSCLSIADDATNDFMETEDRYGRLKIALDKEHIQRSKLRVETRLKLLSKWHPKKYGDKLEIEQKTSTLAIPASEDPVEAQRVYEDFMRPR